MKKTMTAVLGLVCISCIGTCQASNPFDQVSSHADARFLNPFAQDLGVVLGGGTFHTGQALGFPGVDVGVHAPLKRVDGKDDIANAAGLTYMGIPWIQAEVGLPFHFGLIARGITAYGATAIGGGIDYGVFKSNVPGMPQVSLSGTYNQIDYSLFTAHTWSGNAVISFNVPIVTPYLGVGYDSTNLKLKDAVFAGTGVNNTGIEGNAVGYRLEGGVNIGFLPFSYLTLAAGLANGELAPHIGLGVRF
jgi:hypothetical protein